MKQETKTALINALELLLAELKEEKTAYTVPAIDPDSWNAVTATSFTYRKQDGTKTTEGEISALDYDKDGKCLEEMGGMPVSDSKVNPLQEAYNNSTSPTIRSWGEAVNIVTTKLDGLQKSFLDEGKDIPEGKFRSNLHMEVSDDEWVIPSEPVKKVIKKKK